MNSLFAADEALPEGFSYSPDFITSEEEETLINEIRTLELHNMLFQGFEAKRKVASFGYDYSFDNRKLKKGKEIPAAFHWLVARAAKHTGIGEKEFKELLLTEYPPGSVINWHRDALPFDVIAGISLAADCIFRLRPHEKAKQGRKSIISFPVKRRSLYTISGIARSEWQHSISPVSNTRYSITLRTLRK